MAESALMMMGNRRKSQSQPSNAEAAQFAATAAAFEELAHDGNDGDNFDAVIPIRHTETAVTTKVSSANTITTNADANEIPTERSESMEPGEGGNGAAMNRTTMRRGAARRQSVALEELANLTKLLTELSNTLKGVSEKVVNQHAETHRREAEMMGERNTFKERLRENNLRAMFVGHEVTGEEVDSVVNTLTLMNALILTIPYALMSSMDYQYWDWVQHTLDHCVEPSSNFLTDFWIFKSSFNAVVYSAMSSLCMTLVYYILKPRLLVKFRKWWKHARYVILMTLLGTVASVCSMVSISCWLFAWYILPTDNLCFYNSQQENIIGIVFLALTSMASFYLMI